MPWTADDALKHTHYANTKVRQKMWAEIANAALNRGDTEESAIKQANAVVARDAVRFIRRGRK